MASKEHKIVRRAEAMSQLGFLSTLLAERFNVQALDMQVMNRDPELAEIQRIERVNELLQLLVQVSEAKEAQAKEVEAESLKKSTKKNATVK